MSEEKKIRINWRIVPFHSMIHLHILFFHHHHHDHHQKQQLVWSTSSSSFYIHSLTLSTHECFKSIIAPLNLIYAVVFLFTLPCIQFNNFNFFWYMCAREYDNFLIIIAKMIFTINFCIHEWNALSKITRTRIIAVHIYASELVGSCR